MIGQPDRAVQFTHSRATPFKIPRPTICGQLFMIDTYGRYFKNWYSLMGKLQTIISSTPKLKSER